MLELVEMEVQEILAQYEFEDDTPIIRGSALGALNGVAKWEEKVMELMNTCDTWIQEPPRATDKPFLMPVEDVFSITGRGTVATGRIETGVIHVGDEVELLGLGEDKKSVVTGVEMFRKILDEGQAGDNVGLLLRGIDKNEIKRGMVLCHPGPSALSQSLISTSLVSSNGGNSGVAKERSHQPCGFVFSRKAEAFPSWKVSASRHHLPWEPLCWPEPTCLG